MKLSEWIVTILIVLLLFPVFYSIFNVGNPHSIFRFLIKDPSYDISFTLTLSGLIGALAILLYSFRLRDQSPIVFLLNSNIEYIKLLKKRGNSNEEIAESFLNELGKNRGFLYKIAKKKVIRYLVDLDNAIESQGKRERSV